MASFENDRAFEAVLQSTGQNVEVFVDQFFSFLARRSDFFVVTPPEGGRLGLPAGVAAKLVISKFKKWEDYSKNKKKGGSHAVKEGVNPGVAADSKAGEVTPTAIAKTTKAAKSPKESKKTETQKAKASSSSTTTTQPIGSWDPHNGRKTDKYSWSQSIKDLDVHIFVDPSVKTKKQVKVEIQTRNIRVVTGTAEEEVVTDWQLPNPIIKDESYWSLHPGESIFLSLQKVREMWWDHLFEGEECIDRTKIEAVRPMDELDDEEQAKIQELMFNQEQKMKGLPTSEDMKMEEVMRKAWDAEGSPFKGLPFDMSLVKLANNCKNIDPNAPSS